MKAAPSAQTRLDALAETLERVYARYNHRRLIGADPLQFAYRFEVGWPVAVAKAQEPAAVIGPAVQELLLPYFAGRIFRERAEGKSHL